MSGRASTRVAVLKGGRSAERDVSLVSGRECDKARRGAGYNVVETDAGDDLDARLTEAAPDVAFNANCTFIYVIHKSIFFFSTPSKHKNIFGDIFRNILETI